MAEPAFGVLPAAPLLPLLTACPRLRKALARKVKQHSDYTMGKAVELLNALRLNKA